MKRLTNDGPDGIKAFCSACKDRQMFGKCDICSECYQRQVFVRLRDYEIAEEQGRLWMLPATEDGKYYVTCEFGNVRDCFAKIESVSMHLEGYRIIWIKSADEIGKTVFLTRKEAEAALAARGEIGE